MLNSNQISDINSLKELSNLRILHLEYNQISDIESLKELNKLMWLTLAENQINDFSPTSSYYKNLVEKDFELK